ncbi:TetR/AcrR family transcriptional regulator [Dankookia sp. GCM10030260]|uniref:TetR/AcrR family transcriptional regulator n=1 Tax=Dankookia sp. GCM10030260 TaxID=3273390 RepID=UPI0036205726
MATRPEIGQHKRLRTRTALVEAAMRVFARLGPDTPVIGDFIAEAGVARGTFYNYFKTKEELLIAVAAVIADRIQAETRMLRGLVDPADRVACTVRLFIRQAAADATWGWIIVRVALIAAPLGETMRADLATDIADGIAAGRFQVAAPQVAYDLVLGAGLMGMRSVLRGEAAPGHAEAVARMLLLALGVADAAEVAARPMAEADILARSPRA